jgi:hypothetical protein
VHFDQFSTKSWTEAIATLGMRYDDAPSNLEPARKIRYKVVAINGGAELSKEESKVLRQGLLIRADSNDNDHAIALWRASEILMKWRKWIEQSVMEGEEYSTFAKHYLPSAAADNEPAHKIEIKLIKFEQVDISPVALPAKKTREEITMELTGSIIKSTELAAPVRIEYCTSDAGGADNML